MLRIDGRPYRHCDGVTRRTFLIAGALGAAGLTLADILRAEAQSGRRTRKSIINIHLDGGPPQMDLIDPKPGAPVEVRGPFRSIPTSLPGLHLSELMPQVARRAEQFVFIRSLVGAAGKHNAFQCQSGFREEDLRSLGGRPAMGCVLSKLWGSPSDPAPPFVDLMQGRPLVRDSARPGFLGPAYRPFRPDMEQWFSRPLEDGMKQELAARGGNHTVRLALQPGLSARRLLDRMRLLRQLDRLRRTVDQSGMMEAMDQFHQQAASILLSGRFAEALDLQREDPRTIRRYLPDGNLRRVGATSDEPASPLKLLMARRLIEAGVRCVSVSFSDFDTHSDNFRRMAYLGPLVDHALAALVEDLQQRGWLEDVTIVVWGEFGRTPKINARAGRDHWPRVGMAMLAGGGLRTGVVLGATDRYAAAAVARPVHYKDVFATLYDCLGIDALRTTIVDPTGRPRYLLDEGTVIREIV